MSLERKRQELVKCIRENKAKLALLESVVRVKKKDGSDFSAMGKNFSSSLEEVTVKVVNDPYPMKSIDKSLSVYGRVDDVWVDEKIDITPCVDISKTTIDESRIIKEPMVKHYYVMTADEIENALNERIEIVRSWLTKEEETLNNLDELYDIFIPRVKDIMKDLKACCGDNTTLWYDMKDLLKEVM